MADLYKTMRGKTIDMGKLRLQNEKTIAAGNMKVNAKGDQLGRGGKIEKTSQQRFKEEKRITSSVTKQSLKVPLTKDEIKSDIEVPQKTDLVAEKQTKKKVRQKRERELPDGSIEILDDGENL